MKTYQQYLKESKEAKPGALSESAKEKIKKVCESMLHEEAKAYHEDEDASHTYESYIKECGSYMNECMNECMGSM